MKLSECKLGDKVVIFLDSDGEPCPRKTGWTITATVIAIGVAGTDCGGEFLLGWRRGEKRPYGSGHRNGTNVETLSRHFTYSDNQKEFWHCYYGFYTWDIVSREEGDNDWRLFINNKPGECPCGTNRSVCAYHR